MQAILKRDTFVPITTFVGLMWLVHAFNVFLPLEIFGLSPRTGQGLVGILCSPFLHSGLTHLISNTVGILTFGFIFVLLEGQRATVLLAKMVILSGSVSWLLARPGTLVGASGVVFGLFGYLLLRGLFKKKIKNVVVSLIVLVMFWGTIFGVLPTNPHISWEGHLFGFVTGGFLAKWDEC